jgi:transposase
VLAFLTETLAAHRRGLLGPSLLPSAPVPQLALTA